MEQTDQQRLARIEQLVQQWRAGALPTENAMDQIRRQVRADNAEPASFSQEAEIYDKGLG